jgi:hypothetical protein
MRSTVLFAALLAALACGGSDNPAPACEPIACGDSCGSVPDGCGGTLACGACYVPPIVDPTRLGVACPAPEVVVTMPYGESSPAGELQIGDPIYAPSATGGPRYEWTVTGAERIAGQQRLRLTRTDGVTSIFTPDHPLFVEPGCSTSNPKPAIMGWVELQYIRPGWCLRGDVLTYVVAGVENAPDGDVIRISVGDEWRGQAYYADGLWSLAHNASVGPQDP